MRSFVSSWNGLLKKLGFRRTGVRRRREVTTAQLKREACFRPSCEMLESRDLLATYSIAGAMAAENGGTMTLMVSRGGDLSAAGSVDWATAADSGSAAATAGTDYTSGSGTLNFAVNEISKNITVNLTGDTTYEANETLLVNLSNPSSGDTITTGQATGTISNDDAMPTVNFDPTSVTVSEAAGTATFTIKMSAASGLASSVQYATWGASATSGVDFTATSGTANFAVGETTKNVTVPIINDTTYEGSNAESYWLSLSNPSNVTVGASGTAWGYITDNDSLPTISINDVSANESAGSAVFNVTLSNASYQSISVTAAEQDGTATKGWTGAYDYQPITMGMLSFNPGETSKTVSITINNDTLKESDETYRVNLSSPTNATIADGQGDGTILDNDATTRTNLDDQPLCGCSAEYQVGALQMRRELPGGLALRYNSITSPKPMIAVETVQPENSSIPSQIKAELFYNGSLASTVYYNTTGLTAGAAERFVLQADATALATGTYDWTLKLTETVGSEKSYRTFTGKSTIVNRDSGPYGRDWWLEGLDQLVVETGAVSVIYASGATARYVSDGSGGYTKPAGYTEALTKNGDNTYTLRSKDGTKLEFDTAGKLTQRTDRNGNATATYTYTSGLLTKIKDLFGDETNLSYSGGLLQSITDPAGRVATCGYSAGKLTSITYPDPDGAGSQSAPVWNYTYHATTGLLTAEQDPRSNTTSFQWGASGRLSARVLPGNLTYGVTPIATVGWIDVASGSGTSGNPAAIPKPVDAKATLTDPLSRSVYITTDRFGGTLTYKDGLGNTDTYQRNTNGSATQWTTPDPDGAGPLTARVYAYSYDTSQNLTQITNPDSTTRQFTYDSTFNQLTSQTDELGHQTLYTVSATNGNTTASRQVVGQVDSQQNGETNDLVWSYSYTAAPTSGSLPGGLLTDATDPLGRVTHYVYQTNTAAADFGQLTSVVSAYGTSSAATSSFEYDSAHNLTAQTDPLGFRTVYAYDSLGRQTSVTQPDPDGAGSLTSPVTTYVYDARGNVTSQTDPRGFVTTYQYDSLNRLTVQTLPDPDGAGSLTSPVTTYTYDSAGRLTDVTDALGGVTSYQYNANDWKTGEDLPDPDGAGSLTRPHVTYTYDTLGNLTSSTDPLGNVTAYEYNSRGLKTKETAPDPDGAGSLTSPVTQFAYNAAGQVTSQTDPLGRVTTFAYNDLGQLVTRTDPDPDGAGSLTSPVTTYTYDKAGNVLTETDPLGRVTTHAYDSLNRRVSSTRPDPDGAGSLASPVTTYAYDSGGRLTSVTDPLGNVTAYLYDNLGRQTRVTQADPDGAGSLAAPQTNTTYDAAGNVLTVSDPLSRVTTYEYDNLGRQTKITQADPDGAGSLTSPVTTYAYDAAGNLTATTDPLGNTTAYEYDKLGRKTKETLPDPDGAGSLTSPVTTYIYDSASRLTAVIDPLGRTTTFGYDNLGRQKTITEPDPDGAGSLTSPVTTYVYDAASQLTSQTDPLGNVTTYAYDNLGRQKTITQPDPDGAGSLTSPVTTYVYDAASQLTSQTDPLGRTTTYAYDNLGRQISITQPDPDGAGSLTSPVTTTAYDAAGNVTNVTDPLGNVTTYTYDNLYRTKQVTQPDPDGAGSLTSPVTTYVYDAASQLTSQTDPLGRVTTFAYDNLGRQISITQPDPDGAGSLTSPVTTTAYDAAGNVTKVTDPLGNATTYTYDNLYRTKQVTLADPDGAGSLTSPVTTYVYDAASQLTSQTDPLGRTTSYAYDNLGRKTSVTDPDPDGAGSQTSPVTTYAYDAAGHLTGVTNPLTKTTNYEYDNLGRKTKDLLPDPDGAGSLGRPTTTYTYDAVGNLTKLTDPVGNDTVWVYDNLSRVTQQTNELNDSRTFEYDAAGRRTKLTDRNGRVTEYQYDNLGRMTQERWKSGATTVNTQNFAYDAASQMTAASDSYSAYTYTYDPLGRATLIQSDNGGPVVKLAQQFDAASRRTVLSSLIDVGAGFEDDFVNAYTRDNLGRLTRIEQQGVSGGNAVAEKRVDLAYNAAGDYTSINRYDDLAGGSTHLVAQTSYAYDGIGRLTDLTHVRDTTTFADYNWTYDAHGRLTGMQFTSLVGDDGNSTYTYDNTDQLTATDHDFQTDEANSFDENGNRTTSGYTTGTNNQLTSDGTFNYTYDDEGNRLTRTRISSAAADDYLTEYSWDHHNRLTKVTFKNNSGTVKKAVEYTYDIFNRRIKKSIDADGAGSGAATGVEYVYDGDWDIQLAFDGDSSLTNRYLHGPGEDNILADEQFSPSGAAEMPAVIGDLFWLLTDKMNSVRDMVERTGGAGGTGAITVANHLTYDSWGQVTGETNANVDTISGFQGAERDQETGQQNHNRRYLDPRTGRWISEDPIEFDAGDTNISRVVGNAPTNGTDPSGKSLFVDGRASKDYVIALFNKANVRLTEESFVKFGEYWMVVPGAANSAAIDKYYKTIDANSRDADLLYAVRSNTYDRVLVETPFFARARLGTFTVLTRWKVGDAIDWPSVFGALEKAGYDVEDFANEMSKHMGNSIKGNVDALSGYLLILGMAKANGWNVVYGAPPTPGPSIDRLGARKDRSGQWVELDKIIERSFGQATSDAATAAMTGVNTGGTAPPAAAGEAGATTPLGDKLWVKDKCLKNEHLKDGTFVRDTRTADTANAAGTLGPMVVNGGVAIGREYLSGLSRARLLVTADDRTKTYYVQLMRVDGESSDAFIPYSVDRLKHKAVGADWIFRNWLNLEPPDRT